MITQRSALVIGSGFAGLSVATFLAKAGWKVTVLEKNAIPGGRARQLNAEGFVFDMGPSFYWMPDVFERYFAQFGKKVSDYYALERLDPSYRVYWEEGYTDLAADLETLKETFERIEPGSGTQLDKYLQEALIKYEVGMGRFVHKPGLSLTEFMNWETVSGAMKLQLLTSISKHVARHFKHPRLRQLMEFPVLFLGALPQDTPALYSLMNYADIKEGTWFPKGGMYAVVEAMYRLAVELGVDFKFNETVQSFIMEADTPRSKAGTSASANRKRPRAFRAKGHIAQVVTSSGVYSADAVVSGADYHFTEQQLLPATYRTYSEAYWQKRVMAPSCLMYYVGLNKKLKDPVHHSLFFDVSFARHGQEIYKDPQWPTEPQFYVSVSSATDSSVAPPGCENVVFLIPVASGLTGDDDALRERYFQKIVARFEKHLGEPIMDSIIYKKMYAVADFKEDYNSFKGNAYGLANTLLQTAVFRPACRSKKVDNLFYTGQLTVPGPGVPPSLISGEVVAAVCDKAFK